MSSVSNNLKIHSARLISILKRKWLDIQLPSRSQPALGRFVLITGVGHCGTKWLSTVLNQPKRGMVCYHERKAQLTPGTWYEPLRHEADYGIDDYFDLYFRFMSYKLCKYEVVGDSNSWTMARVPEVDRKLSVDLVIHLVRNGIQNVHSHFVRNADRWTRSDWFYTRYLRWNWELAGCPGKDWEDWTKWEAWCFAWSTNLQAPVWMSEALGEDRVLICRLEDLVEDVEVLQALIEKVNPCVKLSAEELRSLQQRDVNRKVQGNRSPEVLWSKWSDEQRAAFERICEDTMNRYGYIMPSGS